MSTVDLLFCFLIPEGLPPPGHVSTVSTLHPTARSKASFLREAEDNGAIFDAIKPFLEQTTNRGRNT